MQAVVATRPKPFWALLFVLAVGAALVIAVVGGYISGSPSHPSLVTSTSVTQPSSGQSGPGPHARYRGYE
jgi:hypothetical protein